LETFLAPSLEDCEKFCPPFEDSMPCPPDNAQCWQTCGVPRLPTDPPAPDSPDLAPSILGTDQDFDPFVIELSWSAVPNASLYIVEFFPQNRVVKSGESNFFQVMTTSLTYKVRKDDECIEYRGRVIAVNSYGISQPVNAYISAPLPAITPTNTQFAVRNMRRDPFNTEKIQVTIDYTLPPKWPLDDIDINGLRVSAVDCKGPLGVKSFGQLEMPGLNVNPSYTAVIGKTPTTAIQLSFNDDMLKSDCFVQMRVSAISTRCNTTVDYEEDFAHAPGVDFRINCDTIPDACTDDSTDSNETMIADPPTELAPIPIPTSIEIDPDVVVPPLNPPGHMPPGIDEPSNSTAEGQEPILDPANAPTPNPWPLFIIGQGNEGPLDMQPVPPVGRVSIIDLAPNGTDVMTMAVIPGGMLPPMCDLEMIDAQPNLSEMSSSVIDLKVMWLERQPLPPPPPASYFVIRYGPIIRRLVDDDREPNEIIPGYETIVRTGQALSEMPFLPDPTREINITGVQRSSLLKIQICAIYDPASEALIQWEFVNSRRIDLAAIEPFLDFEAPAAGPMTPMVPPPDMGPIDMVPPMDPMDLDNGNSGISGIDLVSTGDMGMSDMGPPITPMDPNTDGVDPGMHPVDVPILVQLKVEHKSTPMAYWVTVLTCLLLMILTVMLIFVFLRRMCVSHRQVKALHHLEKPMVIVTTPVTKPCTVDTIKVPLP
jgi:hypothetical protein